MSEIIKSQKRNLQYNGVVDSSDYNKRIEENYDDLVNLYNKVNIVDSKLAQAFERVIKDQAFLVNSVQDLEDRLSALEAGFNIMSIHSYSQIDYASFLSTQFSVSTTDILSFDPYYNVITLPMVSTSSTSKVKFFSNSAGQVIPDYFKT